MVFSMAERQKWTVLFHRDFERELRQLPKPAIRRIFAALEGLEEDPQPPGCGKIKGQDLWKVRVGPYRIVYGIDEEERTISLYRIGHRKDVYWDL
jgi:mRNA interferase RelE/StbE